MSCPHTGHDTADTDDIDTGSVPYGPSQPGTGLAAWCTDVKFKNRPTNAGEAGGEELTRHRWQGFPRDTERS